MTEHLGHLGHAGVGEGILQSLCHSLISGVEVAGDVAILLEQVHATVVLHGRSLHGLVGCLFVSHQTLEHVVGEDGHAGVAHHTVGLVAHKMPDRQFALLLVDMDKGLCHISSLVGMDERHQRHVGTVGVPKRECGIVGELATVYLVIGTTVFAIDVGEYRGSGHRVIHGGVEDGAVVGVAGLNLDFAQLGVPSLVGSLGYSVEVPTGHLGLHVEHGVALVDGRETHLDQHGTGGVGELEHGDGVIALHHLDGSGELGCEIHLLVLGPSCRLAIACYQCWAHLAHAAYFHRIPSDALQQVELHQRLLGIGECVAMHTHALCSGELYLDIGVVELQAIIAGADGLVAVGEDYRVLRSGRYGQQSDVAQVTDAGSAEVGVTETDEYIVAIMIARAPVPSTGLLGRTELDVTEGNIGTEEHVAMAAGSHIGIHILRKIFSVDSRGGTTHYAQSQEGLDR